MLFLSYNVVISASLKKMREKKECKYHDLVDNRNTMEITKNLHEKVDNR